ncbi:MAG: aldose epimerase family protein [Planctomycetota bacterium]
MIDIQSQLFGNTHAGEPVNKTTLTNAHGHQVAVIPWGASLLDVRVPDREGRLANVNMVFDGLDPYLGPHPGFGSSIGRFCNRIGNARFTIDGTEHRVTVNHGKHCLHGGKVNFSHKLWTGESFRDGDAAGVRFELTSPDGEEGFPGQVDVVAEYRWNDASELVITFEAVTDAPTHVNLTNHSYWNLAGVGSGKVYEHRAVIHANEVLTVDEDLIPTGTTDAVAGTPFDFQHEETFGKRIDQLPATKGYDHCYVVAGDSGVLRPAAKVVDPASGRMLSIETTQPGMQLYTANHLPGNENSAGHGGHEAFCLETQHYPDAPNQPDFPSTLLRPGKTLREVTVHRFGVEE